MSVRLPKPRAGLPRRNAAAGEVPAAPTAGMLPDPRQAAIDKNERPAGLEYAALS